MSRQNKKTLFVVFVLAIFVTGIYGIAATRESEIITMREYVDMRFAEFQKAIEKAYLTNERDKEKMNEIRGTLDDARKFFATKESVDKVIVDVRSLQSLADIAQGKASQTSLFIVGMVSFLSLAVQVSKIYIDKNKCK